MDIHSITYKLSELKALLEKFLKLQKQIEPAKFSCELVKKRKKGRVNSWNGKGWKKEVFWLLFYNLPQFVIYEMVLKFSTLLPNSEFTLFLPTGRSPTNNCYL
jgi:hypothetical protein